MAQYTLLDVIKGAGANIEQDASDPNANDIPSLVQYGEQAQNDWKDFADWKENKNTTQVTVLNSMTSIGLDSRFDKLLSPIFDYSTGVDNPTKYIEIDPSERFSKLSSDKYVYLMGDDVVGKYLVINPALGSGASIVFDFQSTPSSLTSTNSFVTCPSKNYMVKRVEYYRLKSRSDPRFPTVDNESKDILQNLLEKHDIGSGGKENRIPDWQRNSNFRIGG